MNRTCEKCIHHDVCRKPLEYSADPETCWKYEEPRPHGEWICKGSVGDGTWCSVCDTNIKLFPNRYSFCPNCGASMISSNSEIEKSKSEIVPDYRDGWRLKGGEKKSCINCGTSECELGNIARYGFCSDWTMREGEAE